MKDNKDYQKSESEKTDEQQQEVTPQQAEEISGGQAGKSPVSSFVCAHCWPRNKCKRMHWC